MNNRDGNVGRRKQSPGSRPEIDLHRMITDMGESVTSGAKWSALAGQAAQGFKSPGFKPAVKMPMVI